MNIYYFSAIVLAVFLIKIINGNYQDGLFAGLIVLAIYGFAHGLAWMIEKYFPGLRRKIRKL